MKRFSIGWLCIAFLAVAFLALSIDSSAPVDGVMNPTGPTTLRSESDAFIRETFSVEDEELAHLVGGVPEWFLNVFPELQIVEAVKDLKMVLKEREELQIFFETYRRRLRSARRIW
jgi:hypothetical protein